MIAYCLLQHKGENNLNLIVFLTCQFDKSWESCSGYHFYDYNDPTKVDESCRGVFDLIVIDPPFISQSVWENYATTARLLGKNNEDTSIIATTVDENAVLMKALFNCKPTLFRPSIPHLVYQYSVFANFSSNVLAERNTELGDDKELSPLKWK